MTNKTWKRPHGEAEVKGMGDGKILITTSNLDTVRLFDKVVEPPIEHKEHPLATIPYSGIIMSDVINQMDGLRLKRKVEEEWGSIESKRRKLW